MKIRQFRVGLLVLLLVLIIVNPANAKNPLDEKHALDVLVQQIKKDKLYENWTRLACLSFVTEGNTQNSFDFAIHEKHGGECPGDPNISPVVDRFRVYRLTHKIQWFEPAEGEFKPYKAILKIRLGK